MRYLGVISVPTVSAKDNATTASPFDLPGTPCSIIFVPSATGLLMEFKAAAAVSTTNGYPILDSPRTFPWAGRDSGKIGLYNPTVGTITCKLYATDASGIATQI